MFVSAIQRANFEDLRERYFRASQARTAVEVLIPAIKDNNASLLSMLLRDYRKRGVRDPKEIELRAAVDALLIGYSVMEMAALSGFILPPDDSTFWKEAETILTNHQMRCYYVDFYPVQLPQVLLLRLQGRHSATESSSRILIESVLQFLELDHRFMRDLNDSHLLRMLDSFWYGGVGFPAIVALIGRRDDFLRSILVPPEERGLCDQVVHQFSLLMQFCFDLQALLDHLAKHKLLQSEIWYHYSYWFGIIGEQMQSQLGEALDQFLTWEVTGTSKEQAKEIKDYVARGNAVIKRLVSSQYRKPIHNLLARLAEQ
jgi:hypothetical protein